VVESRGFFLFWFFFNFVILKIWWTFQ
jgi:hypothetical protein